MLMEKFMVFLYWLSYYPCYKLQFGTKLYTVKFSIKLNTFQIEDLTTNNICEKSEQRFKIDNALVRDASSALLHKSLDDSPVHHPPGKVLRYQGNVLAVSVHYHKFYSKHSK